MAASRDPQPSSPRSSPLSGTQKRAVVAGVRLGVVLLLLLVGLAWWVLSEQPGPRADRTLRLRPGKPSRVEVDVPLNGELRRCWPTKAGDTLRFSVRIPGENAVLRLHQAHLQGLPDLAVRVVREDGLREEITTITGNIGLWKRELIPLPVSAGEQVDLELAVLDGRGRSGLGELLIADVALISDGRAVRPGERPLTLPHIGADLLAPRALDRVSAPATLTSARVDMPGPACLELRDGQSELFEVERLAARTELLLVPHVHPLAPPDVLAEAQLEVRVDGELLSALELTQLARPGHDGRPTHEALFRIDLARFAGDDVSIELGLSGGGNLFVGLREVLLSVPHEADRRFAEEPTERHVVLVLMDGLRGDRLGALGYDRGHTPHLDAMARAGTLWSQVVLPSSWATPNVASLLTGRSPLVHGVGMGSGRRLSPRLPTLAHWASWAGVSSALFSSSSVLGATSGLHEGFERRAFRRVPAPVLVEAALDWKREFAPYDSFLALHLGDLLPPHESEPADLAEVEPHADPALIERLRPLDARDGVAVIMAREIGPLYDAELARVDRALGQLIEGLRELGQLDKTLILVAGTHGQEFYEHGGRGAGQTLFDDVAIVPALAIGPGISALPSAVTEPIALTDLSVLIGERAGLASVEGLPGTSPPPYGPGGTERTFHSLVLPVTGRTQRALEASRRSSRLLLHDVDFGARAFFDLSEDPGARTDLLQDQDDLLITTEAEALGEGFEEWYREQLVQSAAWPARLP